MSASRATLEIKAGPGRGRTFEITPPATIGQSPSCSVVIDAPGVSRVHCVLAFEAGEYTLRDNASDKGTLLNGSRIRLAALRHGDQVVVGPCTLLFQIGVAPRPRGGEQVVAVANLSLSTPPFDHVDARSPIESIWGALDRYKVLFQTAEYLSRHEHVDGFLHVALEQVFDIMPVGRGMILLGTTTDNLTVAVTISRTAQDSVQAVSTTLLQRALAGGEALLIRDSFVEPLLHDDAADPGAAPRSILCVPLKDAETTFGVIQLESIGERGGFGEDDLQLVAVLARHIAMNLSQRKVDERRRHALERSRLRRFLPAPVAERLLFSDAEWSAARTARLSLLFVDLRPAVSLLSVGAPLESINRLCDQLAAIVFAGGGTLGKLTPDALVAFWGAPASDPDGPRRAAEAALTIEAHCVRARADADAHTAAAAGTIRVGLHHGEALVGEFGASMRAGYTAIGPEVDASAHIAAGSPPGAVIASEAFHDVLSTELSGQWVGEAALHPDGAPVRLFRVTGCRGG